MLVSTTDIPMGMDVEILGSVRGNVVYCKNLGRDLMASFKNLAGGEIKSYTDLTNDARTIAEDRMIANAEAMGANAVMGMRFSSASIADGTVDMLCYGTAVRIK